VPTLTDTKPSSLPEFQELIPPENLAICFGGGDFVGVGRSLLGLMREPGGLEPSMRVLDVGCGAGRIAYALAGFLDENGTYDGFDNFPLGVAWCAERYPLVRSSFRFRHANIFNSVYYPHSGVRASEFVFPYTDNTFDFVVLNSVFTHMLPEDVAHYFAEIARVLRPGGRAFMTYFLMDKGAQQAILSGNATIRFEHRFGVFYADDPTSLEDAVAYDEGFVMRLYAASGARVETILRGSWRGEASPHIQDCIVACFP
jgi:SAM-dependent methyltransferase